MRCEVPWHSRAAGIARGLERLGGVPVDRFVVRMAVDPLPVKGDHHLGPETPDLLHQGADHRLGVGLGQRARVTVLSHALHSRVQIAQKLELVDAQHP